MIGGKLIKNTYTETARHLETKSFLTIKGKEDWFYITSI